MLAYFRKMRTGTLTPPIPTQWPKHRKWIEDKPAVAVSILEPMKPPGYLLDMRRKDLLQAENITNVFSSRSIQVAVKPACRTSLIAVRPDPCEEPYAAQIALKNDRRF